MMENIYVAFQWNWRVYKIPSELGPKFGKRLIRTGLFIVFVFRFILVGHSDGQHIWIWCQESFFFRGAKKSNPFVEPPEDKLLYYLFCCFCNYQSFAIIDFGCATLGYFVSVLIAAAQSIYLVAVIHAFWCCYQENGGWRGGKFVAQQLAQVIREIFES